LIDSYELKWHGPRAGAVPEPFRAAVPSSGDALLKTVLFAPREIGSGSQARDAIVTKKATYRPCTT
jgi:hypothetical protein